DRVTRRREQLLDNRVWLRSAFYNHVLRPFGLAEGTLSRFPLASGWVFVVAMIHPLDTPPAGRRESRIMHLTLAEIEFLYGTALATAGDPTPSALPPRQRQVLARLLEGDSEKQIAALLGLSPDTVHEYVKAVYRHFEVNTRAELLAYFLRCHRSPPSPPGS